MKCPTSSQPASSFPSPRPSLSHYKPFPLRSLPLSLPCARDGGWLPLVQQTLNKQLLLSSFGWASFISRVVLVKQSTQPWIRVSEHEQESGTSRALLPMAARAASTCYVSTRLEVFSLCVRLLNYSQDACKYCNRRDPEIKIFLPEKKTTRLKILICSIKALNKLVIPQFPLVPNPNIILS